MSTMGNVISGHGVILDIPSYSYLYVPQTDLVKYCEPTEKSFSYGIWGKIIL